MKPKELKIIKDALVEARRYIHVGRCDGLEGDEGDAQTREARYDKERIDEALTILAKQKEQDGV